MDKKLLEILRCPHCKRKLNCIPKLTGLDEKIIEGQLLCNICQRDYPIIRGIPRFVSIENYATSFGYQWNLYKYTQVDGYTKTLQSENRFHSETTWGKNDLYNNWLLEVGCGNGRFLEICSRANSEVVGVDMSTAIDAAQELYAHKHNIHLIQASIYELPFADETFDKCYCIGVIQHTPNVYKSIESLTKVVKPSGQLALTIYERKPWTLLYAKYWLRPITKRINQKILLFLIKLVAPILFILTEILFRLPIINRLFKFIIPFANYVEMKDLSIRQRYEWAILDTFDMLSPAYDTPMNEKEVRECLEKSGVNSIKRLPNPGINVIAKKI